MAEKQPHASLSRQALLGAVSPGTLASVFVSYAQRFFHRVFPDYFATSALSPSPGPPICRLQPSTRTPGIRTTAPKAFCVASLATLASASFLFSAATMSASSQPPRAPAAINLQALLQPVIADAVQQPFVIFPRRRLLPRMPQVPRLLHIYSPPAACQSHHHWVSLFTSRN